MIVVSDTTPLISLLKICKLDLLEKLFGEVLIPQAVFDELTIDARFQSEADQIKKEKFIIVKSVKNPESANILKRATGLDQGESEAIVLTDEFWCWHSELYMWSLSAGEWSDMKLHKSIHAIRAGNRKFLKIHNVDHSEIDFWQCLTIYGPTYTFMVEQSVSVNVINKYLK